MACHSIQFAQNSLNNAHVPDAQEETVRSTEFLLKVIRTYGTKISFSMSYGSSTSANMSLKMQYCRSPCILKDGFMH